jgi:hypothetical protein
MNSTNEKQRKGEKNSGWFESKGKILESQKWKLEYCESQQSKEIGNWKVFVVGCSGTSKAN